LKGKALENNGKAGKVPYERQTKSPGFKFKMLNLVSSLNYGEIPLAVLVCGSPITEESRLN